MSTTQKKYKDEDWLRTEYVEKGRSAPDIANEINCGYATIYRWLEKQDIETRSAAETRADSTTKKLRDREWLKQEYVEKEKTQQTIADELNYSQSAVYKWLQKHNIERNDRNIEKLRDKAWLIEQYIKKERTTYSIADELGCTVTTIYNWLDEHNIETTRYEHTKKLQDKEWLKEEYVEKGKSSGVISDELGVSGRTVLDWLHKHNIEIKSWYDYHQSVELDHDHIDHKIRSSWELEVAEMLIDNDVDYEYESMEIEYGDSTYIPDFITEDYIIEVKGWVRYDDERKKATTTMEKIDDKEYVVVGSELPCDIHIDWQNNSELVELFT